MLTSIIIFAVTYVLISGRRLRLIRIGRPAGVLLGTVLMVFARVIGPEQAFTLVNWDTIILLLGMMVITEHLAETGFFDLAVAWLERRRFRPAGLLAILVFGSGILSAFLVNDIVCVFFTPLLVLLLRRRALPPLPFLVALATSSNIGSAMALTGNPQNMIIGALSGLAYGRFFLLMLPIGLLGLAVNYGLLLVLYRKALSGASGLQADATGHSGSGPTGVPGLGSVLEPGQGLAKPKYRRRTLVVSVLVVAGFFVLPDLPWTALAGAVLLLFLCNRDEAAVLRRIDWNLLLFFAGLFVVTGALQVSGATALISDGATRFLGNSGRHIWLFGGISVLASNIFSNVPYVLIIADTLRQLPEPDLMWYTLAFASTVAGNLTLIGSVANIIVAEKSRDLHELGFFEFLRFSLPSTLLVTAMGLGVLQLYGWLGWV
ncbi:MAG: SLC13 family permease [Spirochaetia bacterium]|jgi:Na+/H+ antiporter NhaD/arsenite permease-like protein|nr:SLC13 family permease [Spirochaetia bacterium]